MLAMSIPSISLQFIFWASSTYSHRVIVRMERDDLLRSTWPHRAWHVADMLQPAGVMAQSLYDDFCFFLMLSFLL